MRFLRCLLVFLDTQSWCEMDNSSESQAEEASSDDSLDAEEYVISIFRALLEARGICVASIQDELEVHFAGKHLPLCTLNYLKIWYKLHNCPDSER